MALADRTAIGHVAPAVKENNRYIKLTVFPDRVRVAYVIYYGEIPGQRARQEIESNGDDQLDDNETAVLAKRWMQRVEAATSVTVGGTDGDLHWQTVDLGIDDRSVAGGAFSIDLVGWVCIGERPRELVFRDNLSIESPGETEVLLEESPGTELRSVRLGDGPQPRFRWDGAASPLPDGLSFAFTAEGATSPFCRDLLQRTGTSSRWPLAVFLIGLVLALALASGLWIRRRMRAADPPGEPL